MEFIKSFLKLPESERQKVHEAILLLENASSPNVDEHDDSINCSKDLLGFFKKSPVKPASNQKTLDNWIVKKKPLPTANPLNEKSQSTDEYQTLDVDKLTDEEVHTDDASDLQSNSACSSTISNFKEYNGEHLISEVNKRELKVLLKRQDCLETSKYRNNSSVSSCAELLCDVSDNVSGNNCPVSKVNTDADIIESSKLGNLPLKQKTDSDSQLPERSYNLRSARRVSSDTNKAQMRTLNSSPSKSNELSVLNSNSECDDIIKISDVPVKSTPKIKSISKNALGKKAHVETKEIKSTTDLNVCTADINIDLKTDSSTNENIVKSSSGTVKKKMKKTVALGISTKKVPTLNNDTSESIPKQDLKKTNFCLKVSGKTEDLFQFDQVSSNNDIESVNSTCSIEYDSEKNPNANSIKNALVQSTKNKSKKKHDTNKGNMPINTNNVSSTPDNDASSQLASISTVEVPIAKKDRNHVSVNTLLKLIPLKKKSSGEKTCLAKKNKSSLSLQHSPRKEESGIKESKELDKDVLSHTEMKKDHLQISSADIDSNFVSEKKNISDEQITILEEGSSTIPEKINVKNRSEKIATKNDSENLVISSEAPTFHIEAHCNDVNDIKTLTSEEVMPSSEQNSENILEEILNNDSDSSLIEESLELFNISSQKESLKRKNSTELTSANKKPPKRKKSDATFENNSAIIKMESLRSAKNSVKNRNSGIKTVPSNAKSVIECKEEKSINLKPKSCSRRTNKNKLTDLVIPNGVSQSNSNEAMSNIGNKSKNKNSNLSKHSKDHKKKNPKKSPVTILKNNLGEGNTSNNSVLERKKEISDALEKVEIDDENTNKFIKNPLIESNCTKEKTSGTEQINSEQKSVELDDEMNRNYAAFCKMSKILESLKIDIEELFLNQKMKNSLKSIKEDSIYIVKKYNLDVKNSENIYMHESKEELKKILQDLSDK
ncbi:hypothetical protein TNCT_231491 [Trichonephila clavata]|uniref:Uncharacterized protein n=1 Tax=Trichonephila clavata TaxID=2740835 RepID=A0A8X6HPH3_TRICU|nr:hypothetical protein TNCT_231491 [Trichonephila clavata]